MSAGAVQNPQLASRSKQRPAPLPTHVAVHCGMHTQVIADSQPSPNGEARPFYDFLESCLRHKAEMVIFEAARAICNLRDVTARELSPAITVLQLFLSSSKPVLRFAAGGCGRGSSSGVGGGGAWGRSIAAGLPGLTSSLRAQSAHVGCSWGTINLCRLRPRLDLCVCAPCVQCARSTGWP